MRWKKKFFSKVKKNTGFGKRPTNVWVLDPPDTSMISVYHISYSIHLMSYIIYHTSYIIHHIAYIIYDISSVVVTG